MAIAVMTLFSAVTATQYSRLKGDRGFRRIFTIIFMIMAMGYAAIAFAGSYYSVMAGLAVFGLGMGFLVPNMNVWLTSFVPANVRGRAFGLLATAFFLGQFFSPIFSQPLVGEVGISRSFLVAAAILFLAAFLFGSMRYLSLIHI